MTDRTDGIIHIHEIQYNNKPLQIMLTTAWGLIKLNSKSN